jgi:hypothetical protein
MSSLSRFASCCVSASIPPGPAAGSSLASPCDRFAGFDSIFTPADVAVTTARTDEHTHTLGSAQHPNKTLCQINTRHHFKKKRRTGPRKQVWWCRKYGRGSWGKSRPRTKIGMGYERGGSGAAGHVVTLHTEFSYALFHRRGQRMNPPPPPPGSKRNQRGNGKQPGDIAATEEARQKRARGRGESASYRHSKVKT